MHRLGFLFGFALVCVAAQYPAAGQSSPWLYSPLGASGPPGNGTSLVYDPISNELIAFGGVFPPGCCTYTNDTWILTNANGLGGVPQHWQQLSPAGTWPQPRAAASAVYDQASNSMIVFGGGVGGCVNDCVLYDDVWVLSDANGIGGTPTWTQINPSTPSGMPSTRADSAAIYDSKSNRMTIFGGGNNGSSDTNDVWVLTHANNMGGQPEWLPVSPTGPAPSGREAAVVTYDVTSHNMTVFGGCCVAVNDTWILTHADGLGATPAWEQLSPGTPPAPRTSKAYGYDSETNTLIVFGGLGYYPSAFYNDVWVLTSANGVGASPTWVNVIPNGLSGSPPPAVYSPGAYDSISKRLMFTPDPSDLWILTTRNGIDFSGADLPTATQLSEIAQAGVVYAVGEVSGGTSANSAGAAELQAFQNAGFQSAAYCFLSLNATAAPGDQQVNAGISALGGVGSPTFNSVSFIAIDVEEESLDSNGAYDPATLADRLTIIAQALQQITSVGKAAVIYTNQTAWHKTASDAICTQSNGETTCGFGASGDQQAYPLWELTSYNRFWNDAGKEYCGDGTAFVEPFTAFDGWGSVSGKQYDIGTQASRCAGATLSGVQVDFDVFAAALFQ